MAVADHPLTLLTVCAITGRRSMPFDALDDDGQEDLEEEEIDFSTAERVHGNN